MWCVIGVWMSCVLAIVNCSTMSCVREGLSEWPEDIPSVCTLVEMKDSPLENIPEEEFARFYQLTQLHLINLGISDLPNITEAGDTLWQLSLIDNKKLTSLSVEILSSLTKLDWFTVKGSPLFTTLPDVDGPQPTKVDLSYNGLETIPLLHKMGERITVRWL